MPDTPPAIPDRIWCVFEPHRSGKGPPQVYASAAPTKGTPYVPEDRWHRIDDPDNPPPKDGTPILVIAGENGRNTRFREIGVACYGVDGFGDPDMWVAQDCRDQVTTYQPSHWMPLHAPPEDQ